MALPTSGGNCHSKASSVATMLKKPSKSPVLPSRFVLNIWELITGKHCRLEEVGRRGVGGGVCARVLRACGQVESPLTRPGPGNAVRRLSQSAASGGFVVHVI